MNFLSKLWAELLAYRYNGIVYLHHINSKGMWEFEIKSDCSSFAETLYKSKGLR